MVPLLKAIILFFSGVSVFVASYLTQNALVLGIGALVGLTIAFIGFLGYAVSILGQQDSAEVVSE